MGAALYQFSPFTPAAGYPQYSGIEIPQLWSKHIAPKFWDQTLLTSISTTEYEGELKQYGDSLRIRKEPDVNIRDYVPGQPIRSDYPQATYVDLAVNRGKYWSVALDSVSKSQMDLDWTPKWTTNAAKEMKVVTDTEVLAWLPSHVSSTTSGIAAGTSGLINLGAVGAPILITTSNAVNYVMYCEQIADELNWPEEGRWIILPPAFETRIKTGELKAVSVSGDSKSPLRNGLVGTLGRFNVLRSNLLAKTTDNAVTAHSVLFGWKGAFAFAHGLVLNQGPITPESTFAEIYRGLMVYGYQLILANAVGHLYCYFADLEAS